LSWLSQEALPGGRIEGLPNLFRVMGSTVLVTCGTGYGFVPLRYGAAPEVAILTIVPLAAPGDLGEAGTALPDSLLELYQANPRDSQDSGSVARKPGSP